MELGELGIPIDSSRSCVLQLSMSVICGMLFTNTICCVQKDFAKSFRMHYTASCICKQHAIDNAAGRKQSHVIITSVHLRKASLWTQAAKFKKNSGTRVAPRTILLVRKLG